MPFETEIDTAARLVRVRVSGSFVLEEVLHTIGKVIEHPDFEPGFNILSDHTGLTEFLTSAQAKGMAEFLTDRADVFRNTKWAVVTVHPASIGMMRVAAVFLQAIPVDVRAFPSEAEALGWLGGLPSER